MRRLTFPAGFLWGTSTSAHQVEGGNENNDWSEWERRPGAINDATRSGAACGWWEGRAEEDLAVAATEGQNAHRLSLEWSRLEPEPGRFDDRAFARYGQLLDEMRRLGLLAMVTLHHVTLPRWVARRGGWTSWSTVDCFARYAQECARRLAGRVPLWVTMNEPAACAAAGYALTYWPPRPGLEPDGPARSGGDAGRACSGVPCGEAGRRCAGRDRAQRAADRAGARVAARRCGGLGPGLVVPGRDAPLAEDRRPATAHRRPPSTRPRLGRLARFPRRELLRPVRRPVRLAQRRHPLRKARAGTHHPDARVRLARDLARRPHPATPPPVAARGPAVRAGERDPRLGRCAAPFVPAGARRGLARGHPPGSGSARLLPLVARRQFRVGGRLGPAIRFARPRSRHPASHAAWQRRGVRPDLPGERAGSPLRAVPSIACPVRLAARTGLPVRPTRSAAGRSSGSRSRARSRSDRDPCPASRATA